MISLDHRDLPLELSDKVIHSAAGGRLLAIAQRRGRMTAVSFVNDELVPGGRRISGAAVKREEEGDWSG
jgi:hypothetical protein